MNEENSAASNAAPHAPWTQWENVTVLERRYIAALRRALPALHDDAQRTGHLRASYVGGSFVRRKLTHSSDIDIYLIVDSHAHIGITITAAAHHATAHGVPIQIHVYAREELETGEYHSSERADRTLPPGALVRELSTFVLVHGKPLASSTLRPMSDEDYVRGLVAIVRTRLGEDWGEREPHRLRFLAKQLLHLVKHDEKSAQMDRRGIAATVKHGTSHIAHICTDILQDPAGNTERALEIMTAMNDYLLQYPAPASAPSENGAIRGSNIGALQEDKNSTP